MPNYAVRITHTYANAQSIVSLWALKCDKMAVFQHVGEKTEKPHIHLSLEGTNIEKKQLRNLAASTGVAVKGNEYMSFKNLDSDPIKYFVYMTKGKHDASYLKGYIEADVENWKSQWVQPEEYEKQSKWQQLGEQFLKEFSMVQVNEEHNLRMERWLQTADAEPPRDTRFQEVSNGVLRFIHNRYKGWVPPQGRTEHRFLVWNICMSNRITIPDNYKY